MPELPEVEVLRRSLEPHLLGRRIESAWIGVKPLREPLDRRALRAVAGATFSRLDRRSKYLLARLDDGRTLAVHLGMSGRLTLVPPEAPHEPHEHARFRLEGGRELRFRDPRRFGALFVVPRDGETSDRRLAGLGREPLDPPLRGDELAALAAPCRGPVKSFLMDGRRLVGVGNIYATEALHRAGIHPSRSVRRLSLARWERLAAAVVAVLERAIARGGTTLNDFADGEGNSGYFQIDLAVYGRDGEPCPRCGRAIRRIVQGGRSSFYCPGCQR